MVAVPLENEGLLRGHRIICDLFTLLVVEQAVRVPIPGGAYDLYPTRSAMHLLGLLAELLLGSLTHLAVELKVLKFVNVNSVPCERGVVVERVAPPSPQLVLDSVRMAISH